MGKNSMKTWIKDLFIAPLADEEAASDLNCNTEIDFTEHPMTKTSSSQCGSSPGAPIKRSSANTMDMNMYATRKTIAQGIMDLGLMCANASQLKYVLINADQHRYFHVTISLIVISIIIQVIIGIIFIVLGRLNINYSHERRRADMMNNLSVILIFLVTVVNVLITAFGPSESSLHHHGSGTGTNHGSSKLTSWTNYYPASDDKLTDQI